VFSRSRAQRSRPHCCADLSLTRVVQGDYLTKKKKSELPVCPGPDQCPLGVDHPPNGTEFALGCGICRPRVQF
jgi:hypothetical protein